MTAYANQTTGLNNDSAVNWAPEVMVITFQAPSHGQLTFLFCW